MVDVVAVRGHVGDAAAAAAAEGVAGDVEAVEEECDVESAEIVEERLEEGSG